MGIEGRLLLTLELDRGGVDSVSIESSRPVHAAAVLRGKTPVDVQKTVPLLFSVCATAQACAAVRALEKAEGIAVTATADNLRQTLVDLETLREHLWRVLLEWPGFVGEAPVRKAMAEVVSLQRQLSGALCQGGDAFAFGGFECSSDPELLMAIHNCLLELLAHEVYGVAVEEWLEISDYPSLSEWAVHFHTPAGLLMQKVMEERWEQAGKCESRPLPTLPLSLIHI